MNNDNINYCLGHLANSAQLSAQCLKIRKLVFADAKSDQVRLDRVLDFLNGAVPLNPDTLEWLNRAIHPLHAEGYNFDISPHEEAAFWKALSDNYPGNAKLLRTAADAAFLINSPNALAMFMDAFTQDSSLIYGLDGSIWDAFQSSPYKLSYYVIMVRNAVAENDPELDELLAELYEEFSHDPQAVRWLQDAVPRSCE